MRQTVLLLTLALTALQLIGSTATAGPSHKIEKEETNMKEFNPAFAHTVFFWLKNPDNKTDRKTFETALQKFLDTSLHAKTGFIGTPPVASRDVVDGSFTYSLIVTFDSPEAQAKYQQEEAHSIFVSEAESLWSKVIVYDSTGLK